jgi:clorobiocin biosynthesis protein CloN7
VPVTTRSADGGSTLRRVVTTRYRPDLNALKSASARVVVAGGSWSKGQSAYRASVAPAEVLGTPLVEFPGGHGGFMDQPAEFLDVLRRVLRDG